VSLGGSPNIVFITVDTTRADRMGFSRQHPRPHAESGSRGPPGRVFERAFSQAPLTPVSRTPQFYRDLPSVHTVTDFGHPLPTLLPYLPDILQKTGYHTAAFIGSIILDPNAGMGPGFDRARLL